MFPFPFSVMSRQRSTNVGRDSSRRPLGKNSKIGGMNPALRESGRTKRSARFIAGAIICAFAWCSISTTSLGAVEAPSTQPSDPAPQSPPQVSSKLHPNVFWNNDALKHGAHLDNSGGGGDPIGPLASQMDDIGYDLGHLQTGKPVQTKEKSVVASLDELIEELEKQKSGSGGGGNPNPTNPMQHSILAKGPGGQGPLHDPLAGTRVWGQLPPKQREQILQSQTEGFPPGYESVLSSYYGQLAHGQTGGPDAGGTDASSNGTANTGAAAVGPTTLPAAP
jgi:hypothetical protein